MGLLEYERLASHTQLFDAKWVVDLKATNESILGTEDIQSLGALGDSYDMIRPMKLIPL